MGNPEEILFIINLKTILNDYKTENEHEFSDAIIHAIPIS
jgi:hypothetical protein